MGKKVCVVIGTRPEAIKLAPVILELQAQGIDVSVCTTGQHKDMVDGILDFFEIHDRDSLNIPRKSGTLAELTSLLLTALDDYFSVSKPDHVIVQGDTTTAFIGALAAFYRQIPVSHVEAGLRTFNKFSPWPEEMNRSLITSIADLHFAPTERARDNLLTHGVPSNRIFITGNTVIDALLIANNKLVHDDDVNYTDVLITCHRRENLGESMSNIFTAVSMLAERHPELRFVFPMHPNPQIRTMANEILGARFANVLLREPADYPEFVMLMKRSLIILTDSGGVQEEAPSLGKPVLVMRDTTERPEGVEAGTVKLVGTDIKNIVDSFFTLVNDKAEYERMANANNPYGDGVSAKLIIDTITSSHNF